MGATTARATTNGPKTIAIAPITASVLARSTQAFVTGAEAIRSGASSPETASHARPPANCPAAMIGNHRSRFPERPTWGVDNEHYHLSDVYLDRFNYPGLIGTPPDWHRMKGYNELIRVKATRHLPVPNLISMRARGLPVLAPGNDTRLTMSGGVVA